VTVIARTVKLKATLVAETSGVVVGLFLARVLLEVVRQSCPGGLVLLVALACGLAGLILGRWASQHFRPMWPALFLLVYVLWPQRASSVAVGATALAVFAWLLVGEHPLPLWAPRVADGLTLLVALISYVTTVAPDVLAADSGEFQLVAARLGVAHPPGYPLYTLVGHLFTRLWPWGAPAYRLNLLSALLAACTVTVLARATRIWAMELGASLCLGMAAGLAAALTLGTATTFWAQATIANIRMPTALCTALILLALAWFDTAVDSAAADRALLFLGLGLGLGLGHHPSLVFPAIFFIAYVVLVDPRLVVQPRRWWRAIVAGLVGLLPYAYLPIGGARGACGAPPGLDTLSGFLHHALARGFGGDMFAYVTVRDLPHRLTLVPTLYRFQFNTALLLAAALGAVGLLRHKWRLFAVLVGSLLLHTFVTITYRAPQTVEYLMPAYLPLSVAVGLLPVLVCRGLQDMSGRLASVVSVNLAALTIVAGFANGWTHRSSFVELAQDRSTRETVEPLLQEAPVGAIIMADWRWATPLWYLQQVEGQRPDVQVEYVYNVAGEEYYDTWERQIRALPRDQSLLLTHFFEFEGYTTEPWGTGFVIRPSPVEDAVAPLASVDVAFGRQVRVLGYNVRLSQRYAGGTVELDLAWRATQAWEQPPSFTLRLMGNGGECLAQADQTLDVGVSSGEVRFERLVLPLYPELTPGRYELHLGAYVVTDEGFENLVTAGGEDSVVLTGLDLAPIVQKPYTLHPLAVPFGDGPTLVGVDYDRSLSGALRVYLHWQGPMGEDGGLVQVETSEGAVTSIQMPAIQDKSYQTVAMDVADVQDGSLRLSLVDAQGVSRLASGPWGWRFKQLVLPDVDSDARFVPVGGDMAVIGAAAQTAPPGEDAVIDVELVCLRPLTDDLATSVRLMDADGRWLARHDMQPVQGAVPTLKWIRGSRVIDRHLLSVPEGFTGDTVQAALVAYERFRGIALPVLDGRFSDVPLGSWPQPY